MIVFIDDRPLRLIGLKTATRLTGSPTQPSTTDFDNTIDARLTALKGEALIGHLLILNATPVIVDKLLALLQKTKSGQLLSITLGCISKSDCETAVKKNFKIIKAAGGVVGKDNKILMMFRRGVWDLPKGKLDGGESSREGAAREVEEETGVRVRVGERICTTWHNYALNGSRILKRTKWYHMTVVNDANMAPQAEEGIEQLAWLDARQTQQALTNSFSSIRFVVEESQK
jgi:ADP-ribose pyrophosphatase YjhB (NUDIX family)